MPNPRRFHHVNFSGTINEDVPKYFTVEDAGGAIEARLRAHAASLGTFLTACFADQQPVRALGAGLSFSDVARPVGAAIDTHRMNEILEVQDSELSAPYRTQVPPRTPMYVQGGTVVSRINARLGAIGLALQTSGAGDAHRIAGCVATGTHGSALEVGAVHDTAMAVHLLVAPREAAFVLPEGSPITDDLPNRLAAMYGIPTVILRDDEVFAATLVSLGSLGVVLGIVIETVPLYRLERRVKAILDRTDTFWDAVRDTDPAAFIPAPAQGRLHHFEVLFHPYRAHPDGTHPVAYMSALWKTDAGGARPGPVSNRAPKASSFAMHLASVFAGLGGPSVTSALRNQTDTKLAEQFAGANLTDFPGAIFGTTDLPRGYGASIELVVDQVDAVAAIQLVQKTVTEQAEAGRNLIGVFSCRHVCGTRALLGMNQREKNCFIEMPSAEGRGVQKVYEAVGAVLTANGIAYGFHWGQQTMSATHLDDWYTGGKRARWRAVRRGLLSARAQQVFEAPLLARVGLD